jgi:hypothetical protein
MVDDTIAASVRKYLGALQATGINARCGVVFGSRTKSCSDVWSDIEVLVVSPLFDAAARASRLIRSGAPQRGQTVESSPYR